MTREKISEYDAVAANNTDVNGVNIAENCPPSGMNNMGREIMAALKRFQVGSDGDGVTVGGQLTVTGTTTTSPAIVAAGDTNTGIFFPAADTIAFAGGGAEAMRIDSSGRVGIGQTNPSQLLVVGATNPVSNASVTSIRSTANLGNCYEWGHSNPAGYRSTLGAYAGAGQPFIGFSCEAGTTINTFRTRGIAGSILSTDNAGALIFSRVTNANADNQTPAESMRITSDAYLRMASGTGGIQFNGDTAAANALDDYEEGTWTPVLNSFGGTSLTATGQYTKIGRFVMLTFQVGGTNLATTLGTSYVSNLPFIGAQSNAGGASWASSNTAVSFGNTLIVTNAVYAPTQAATGSTLSFVATYNV